MIIFKNKLLEPLNLNLNLIVDKEDGEIDSDNSISSPLKKIKLNETSTST